MNSKWKERRMERDEREKERERERKKPLMGMD